MTSPRRSYRNDIARCARASKPPSRTNHTQYYKLTHLDEGHEEQRRVGVDEHEDVELGDQCVIVVRVRPAATTRNIGT
jgi:hypothetical protein